jgi:hypothetical protein
MPSVLRLLQDFDATAERIGAATLDEEWTLLERLYDLVRAGRVLVEMGPVDPGEHSRLRAAYSRVSAIDNGVRDHAISQARGALQAELVAMEWCETALNSFLAATEGDAREKAAARSGRGRSWRNASCWISLSISPGQ